MTNSVPMGKVGFDRDPWIWALGPAVGCAGSLLHDAYTLDQHFPITPESEEITMSLFDGEYEPSPWEPIAAEVARYEESNGTAVSELVGDQWIVLWTIGAKSNKVRKTPLVRTSDEHGRFAVIGSQGGAPTNPNWVHNLRAHGVARVQDGGTLHDLVPREVTGDEKAEWWARAVAVWPSYDEYQQATDRVIPVFVLEPAGESD